MNNIWLDGYKVTRKIGIDFISATTVGREFVYNLNGLANKPKKGDGPFAVFTTLENVKEFIWEMRQVKEAYYVFIVNYKQSEHKKLWYNDSIEFYKTTGFPIGTDFADEIIFKSSVL